MLVFVYMFLNVKIHVQVHFTVASQYYVYVKEELFFYVFMHLFKRADGFYAILYVLCETLVERLTSFVDASQKRRSSNREQYYKREADWKETGE